MEAAQRAYFRKKMTSLISRCEKNKCLVGCEGFHQPKNVKFFNAWVMKPYL